MGKPHVITTRVDDDTLAQLDRLSGYTDRSRAWLVAEAVRKYVQEEAVFFEFLREGEEAIDAGDFITHEQLAAKLNALKKAKRAA
jgi:RHH-type rel operon transcriptional repressor/antitoxin RelB